MDFFQGGFGISLMKKDLKIAIQAAAEAVARLVDQYTGITCSLLA